MTYVEWEIKGREFINCNCAHGCPCQFNALPTYGDCMAVGGYQIDQGHFGDVRLDGLRAAMVWKWPGAVHEGNGTLLVIIDAQADASQREALRTILYGEESEPGSTMWNVFMSTMSRVLDPLYTTIQFEVDIDGRRARLVVPGLMEGTGEPIRNPVTGDESRVRINFPEGFEFTVAEIGSGTSKVTAGIPMELTATHGHFANLHLSTHGVVR
jgi:hypothetical protein